MSDHEWREEQSRIQREFEARQARANFAVSLFCGLVWTVCAVVWVLTIARMFAAPVPG